MLQAPGATHLFSCCVSSRTSKTTRLPYPFPVCDRMERVALDQKLVPIKLEMQCLDHHKKQFLDLHAELHRIEFSPQSEAALENFKAQLLLEVS
jgi:hypothetical protein